jgi:hypothetical protein
MLIGFRHGASSEMAHLELADAHFQNRHNSGARATAGTVKAADSAMPIYLGAGGWLIRYEQFSV